VSDEELARNADVEQVSRTLAQSLKACRSMIASYRAALGAEANDNFTEALIESAKRREADEG
jgi:hypothetical protein